MAGTVLKAPKKLKIARKVFQRQRDSFKQNAPRFFMIA
jgi:hypothetical protein